MPEPGRRPLRQSGRQTDPDREVAVNRLRAAGVAVPLGGIVLAAAAGAWSLNPSPAPAAPPIPDRIEPVVYRTFDGCQSLVEYLRSHARSLVGPYGLQGGFAVGSAVGVRLAGGEVAASGAVRAGAPGAMAPAPLAATAAPADSAARASDTGTNVQVAGVDEADVSKRAGDLLLTVTGRTPGLTVLRVGARSASVAGRLDLGWRPSELLLDGHAVLLLGSPPGPSVPGRPSAMPSAEAWVGMPRATIVPQRTRIAEVDVADPSHPHLVRTLDVDGSSVGARLAGGVLRLAVSAAPDRLPFVVPQLQGPLDPAKIAKAEAAALARNRGVVAASRADQWLPRYMLTPSGEAATSGSLLSCDSVGVPDSFSGLGTVALLTFDLHTGGISRWRGGGVVTGGTTLYSTGDHTYVTTSAWRAPVPVVPPRADDRPSSNVAVIAPPPAATQIHAFSTTADGVRYLGSGQVDGRLLDQYALDEYQGRLRVATTTEPAWSGEQPFASAVPVPDAAGETVVTSSTPQPAPTRTTSSSVVTVLPLRGGRLVRVGHVGGLGAGELIRGVRFAGPLGYVVTFRRTDPLYTLDLSDPAHPAVAGELTLLGYSAYLHPIGGGLLLGVGQDASANGAVQGVQLSLFDVHDPAHPRLLDRVTLPGSWAGTEADPHAFAYAGGLALVPVGTGVLAVRVDRDRLETPGVLQLDRSGSPELDPTSVRTFADAATLWTIAPEPGRAVLAAHDAVTLAQLSAVSF
jgi:Beta propeller domain